MVIVNGVETKPCCSPNKNSQTLLSEFAFEIPSSICQCKLLFGLIFGIKARRQQFSSELRQVVENTVQLLAALNSENTVEMVWFCSLVNANQCFASFHHFARLEMNQQDHANCPNNNFQPCNYRNDHRKGSLIALQLFWTCFSCTIGKCR